jgi:probable HAF family extracellular repeat protein
MGPGDVITRMDEVSTPHGIPPGSDLTYTIVDLGVLPGHEYSEAWAVNNAGWVVGESGIDEGEVRAFLWKEGVGLQSIGTLGGSSHARDVNNNGDVVGYSVTGGAVHGFYWTETGGMTDIGVPPTARFSYLHAVNDQGHAVGMALTSEIRAIVLWRDGVWDILSDLGGTFSSALDINEADRVSGAASFDNGDNQAVLWDPPTTMDNLGTLGGAESEALAINEFSQVVGWSDDAQGRERAFIWTGDMHDLGTLGGAEGAAKDINDDGYAVGESQTPSGEFHATLWTPDGDIIDLGSLVPGGESIAMGINTSGMVTGYAEAADGMDHAVIWIIQNGEPEDPTVEELFDDLTTDVRDLYDDGTLNQGLTRALLVKLWGAERKFEDGGDRPAINKLRAFINQVRSLARTRRISREEAQDLIDQAQALIDLIRAG